MFLLYFILTNTLISYPQSIEKDSAPELYKDHVGFQVYPYWTKNIGFTDFIYDLRYGHKISKALTIGVELSETVPRLSMNHSQYYDFKFGMFARYSIFNEKRFQGFIEGSSFYSHRNFKGLENLVRDTPKNTIGVYIAPGASIFTKNRRFSMDFYYKIYVHPTSYWYYNQDLISYKLNFHF